MCIIPPVAHTSTLFYEFRQYIILAIDGAFEEKTCLTLFLYVSCKTLKTVWLHRLELWILLNFQQTYSVLYFRWFALRLTYAILMLTSWRISLIFYYLERFQQQLLSELMGGSYKGWFCWTTSNLGMLWRFATLTEYFSGLHTLHLKRGNPTASQRVIRHSTVLLLLEKSRFFMCILQEWVL